MANQSTLKIIFKNIGKKKIETLNIFGIFGLILLIIYCSVNFILQDYPFAFLELFLAIIALLGLFILNVLKRPNITLIIDNFILLVLALYIFIIGGAFTYTGILWIFVIAAFMFFVNFKDGIYWVTALILTLLGVFSLQLFNFIELPYQNFNLMTFFICLSISSILTHLYIIKIEQGYADLDKTYEELQEALHTIGLKELETQSLLDEINLKSEELENYICKYGKSENDS